MIPVLISERNEVLSECKKDLQALLEIDGKDLFKGLKVWETHVGYQNVPKRKKSLEFL